MQQVIINISQSKSRPMVLLRSLLAILIGLMGLAKLRIHILLLMFPNSYQKRDILQEYLQAKALLSGINPYLPLDKLAEIFVGYNSYLPHPSPYPPIIAVLFAPLVRFGLNNFIVMWFVFEFACLIGTALLLSAIIKGRVEWLTATIILFIMISWDLVMIELFYGQTSILLTFLLAASIYSLQKNKKFLAGALIGLSVALKIITWPIVVYFLFKKDWRAFLSSAITAIGLNIFAAFWMGLGPLLDYYQHVTREVWNYYHAIIYNLSLWSVGFRIFDGIGSPTVENYFKAPPLVNLPMVAMIASALLAGAFFVIGMNWAVKSKELTISFSILICVIIAISPTSWVHYYVMLSIGLLFLWQCIAKLSFPTWKTLILMILFIMFFIGNNYTQNIIIALNGGQAALEANNFTITFWSSLLIYIPLVELLILCGLLWQTWKELDARRTEAGTPSTELNPL